MSITYTRSFKELVKSSTEFANGTIMVAVAAVTAPARFVHVVIRVGGDTAAKWATASVAVLTAANALTEAGEATASSLDTLFPQKGGKKKEDASTSSQETN